jgi:hypothetical protein
MLQQLLQGTSMADVNRCLKGKRSLLGLLGGDKLGAFCVQLIHMEPWAVVVILQAEIDSQITIGDFSNAFMLCPRDLPCGCPIKIPSSPSVVQYAHVVVSDQLGAMHQILEHLLPPGCLDLMSLLKFDVRLSENKFFDVCYMQNHKIQ